MKIICKTCGGECALVRSTAVMSEYKCKCCDNSYTVRKGEERLYAPKRTPRKKPDIRPKADGIRFETRVTPAEANPAQPAPAISAPSPQPVPVSGGKLNGEQVYARCISCVMEVRAISGRSVLSGSAYAVDANHAVTNAHVVVSNGKAAERVEVYVCGKTCKAQVSFLGTESEDGDDLALLTVTSPPADMKPVTFADFSKVRNGQTLFVIGNSLGGGTCITSGIVSDRLRKVEGKPRLMTDCAINRGNSGGPVFNDRGEVAGTVVAVTTTAEGMNYAIPADRVKLFLTRCGVKI